MMTAPLPGGKQEKILRTNGYAPMPGTIALEQSLANALEFTLPPPNSHWIEWKS